ncbi:MAG TPA: tripartite tricarboxylate transporter substrate-binding protein, partial [Burkholderiales bacterium]|nr:tripartite tricarboxylate transporter substrate-binding protein [Burkholderiales bacterium]
MKRFTICGLSVGALLFSVAVLADYPEKPVRIIVPFEPGGGVDIAARTVQPGLTEALRQPVVIENRSGAGGIIGAAAVAKAAPDGYTLLMGSSSTLTVAPNLYKNIPYSPLRDFAPISGVETKPYILVVHPVLPAKTVKDLVSLARKASLTMSSAGTGSSNHLTGELFQMLTGVRFTHVPYKGGAPAALALIGGQVDL